MSTKIFLESLENPDAFLENFYKLHATSRWRRIVLFTLYKVIKDMTQENVSLTETNVKRRMQLLLDGARN